MTPELALPPGGLNIRWPDPPNDQEFRLQRYKLPAALAFARANALDRTIIDSRYPRLGLVTTGKAHLDVLQALEDLGIDRARAADVGIKLFKVGMSWPLEPEAIRQFAEGLEEIIVVEEKRGVVESQLKEQLYNWQAQRRPLIVGKQDERGEWLLPPNGELTPALIARVLAKRMRRFHSSTDIEERVRFLEQQDRRLAAVGNEVQRLPHFCSGCPHNTSTRVPEGSRAVGGIGCHFMAAWMDRDTVTFTQMGGEGATWIGQAPFTETPHVFQNLGDGTYAHSGTLAIRAAVAAGVNMTYKILFNDAVAMTGGQPVEGHLTVAGVAQQLVGEGVQPIIVVTDEPQKYRGANGLPPSVTVHHRRELERLQRELRDVTGVSALIYDQTCAAELHRKRKRGLVPTPDRRVVINELVCEGCGDCSVQSNCLSVMALETEFGRKRRINQSSCNQDFSCLNGFCPSFVTLKGAKRNPPRPLAATALPSLPRAAASGARRRAQRADRRRRRHGRRDGQRFARSRGASRRQSGCCSSIKPGSRRSTAPCCRTCASRPTPSVCTACAFRQGRSISCSARTSSLPPARSRCRCCRPTGRPSSSTRTRKCRRTSSAIATSCFPARSSLGALRAAGRPGRSRDARRDAARVGAARRQHRRERADARVRISARPVARLGRRALSRARALRPQRRREQARVRLGPVRGREPRAGGAARDREGRRAACRDRRCPTSIARREEFLVGYQDRAYAERYRARVEPHRGRRAARSAGQSGAARSGRRATTSAVLAYKDEYEVARLHTESGFVDSVKRNFGAGVRMSFHFSPPLFAKLDPATGRPRKYEFGPWILAAAARAREAAPAARHASSIRSAWSADRRLERELLTRYEALLDRVVAELDDSRFELAARALRGCRSKFAATARSRARRRRARARTSSELWQQWVAPAARAAERAGERGVSASSARCAGVTATSSAGGGAGLGRRGAANAAVGERIGFEPRHRDRFAAVGADAVGAVLDLIERPGDLADLAARLVAERVDDLGVLELLRLLLRVGAAAAREVFLQALQPARELRLLRDRAGLGCARIGPFSADVPRRRLRAVHGAL